MDHTAQIQRITRKLAEAREVDWRHHPSARITTALDRVRERFKTDDQDILAYLNHREKETRGSLLDRLKKWLRR